VAPPKQRILDLLLDHTLLDSLQEQLAFCEGEAEGFHRHFIALDPRHFPDMLVTGGVHHHQLKSECDAGFCIARGVVVSS
jgi:hypothetical protein